MSELIHQSVNPTYKSVRVEQDTARRVDRESPTHKVGAIGEPHIEAGCLPVEDGARLPMIQAILRRSSVWPRRGFLEDWHHEPLKLVAQAQEPEPLVSR